MSAAPVSASLPLWERVQTPNFFKLVRYATVSVISTVLSLVLLYVFLRVANLEAWVANVVATIICTVPSYYLNRTWAWGRTGKSHFKKEVLPFWVISFLSLGLSTAAVALAAHETRHVDHHIQTIVILGANFVTYGVIWVGKFLLFNKVLFNQGDGAPPIVLVAAEDAPHPVGSPRSGYAEVGASEDPTL